MLRTQLFPLRNTVGKPIGIKSAQVVGRVEGLAHLNVQKKRRTGMNISFLRDALYAKFLPTKVIQGSKTYRPGPGAEYMTYPSDLSFNPSSFYSLWGLGDHVRDDDLSRDLWVEYRLNLEIDAEIALVGGICYGGYPYMPYYITPQGENSSNFGLPREIRVSWTGQHGDEFLDAESSLTQQEPASHSGVHIFPINPIKTSQLTIRLSDFPRIITDFSDDQVVENWGFIIPYILVYEYKEHTRYHAHVPAGLLGVVHNLGEDVISTASNPKPEGGKPVPSSPHPRRGRPSLPSNRFLHYYFEQQMNSASLEIKKKYAYGSADYLILRGDHYFPSSGASIFQDESSRRKFVLNDNTIINEQFESNGLFRNDELFLYIEQTEEQPRSLAGIRITFEDYLSDHNLNSDIPIAQTATRVYELDPPEGVSPLALDDPPEQNKYATLIATEKKKEKNTTDCKLQFIRPSSSRYFVVVLRAVVAGYIFIRSVELVQSVHVAVSPRASRHQYINAMHFRLIGPELAEDYARLGSDGFSFSVEHQIAGQTKNILFSANSLLDLLQTGAARLYSNHRRRMEEKEISETHSGSYSLQETATLANGWNRSETGISHDDINYDKIPIPGLNLEPNGEHGYTVLGNQETRNRTQHVIARTDPHNPDPFDLIGQFLKLLDDFYPDFKEQWGSNNEKLWEGAGGTWRPWKNVNIDELKVSGVWNINASPGFQGAIEYTNSIIDLVKATATLDAFNVAGKLNDFVNQYFDPDFYRALLAVNGLGGSIGGGAGVTGSISANLGLPSIVNSGATGSSGNISRQGSQTHYSYAQYLNNHFDQLSTRTEYPEGKMIRQIRREAAGIDTDRIKGAEVMWQEQLVDIVTGTIPLNIALPATAGNIYRTTDELLRVRLGGSFQDSLSVDIWFDVREEMIRDDY